MNNIGRNELCPCGSGKKYKKCCLRRLLGSPMENWKMNAEQLVQDVYENERILDIYLSLLDIVVKLNWEGACHATSSIMYVLFKEIGLNVDLCIGEVYYDDLCFDHSWIEIDNNIYDIAVYKGLYGRCISEPIINGYNIETKEKCKGIYGGNRIYSIDSSANRIMQVSLVDYLSNFKMEYAFTKKEIKRIEDIYDSSKEGFWGFISIIAEKIGIKCDIEILKEKYKNVERIEK